MRPVWERFVPCSGKKCRKRIVWLKTAKGKNMPIDAETVEPGDTMYRHGKHTPHWATCPDAKAFGRTTSRR